MSMAIGNLLERKDDVVHVKGGMMAISHLLKGRNEFRDRLAGQLPYTKRGRMVISHLFKGKENERFPCIEREG